MYDLSVVIPSFQKASHLRRNLLSLSLQTMAHDRYEAIVVDDGSTDHTYRVVQEARQKYDYQIRYFYLNRSGDTSPALSWNYGITRAQSDLIVQMGADIIAQKDTLALLHFYQQESDGDQYTFGQCYLVHSALANSQLDHLPWSGDMHILESVFIAPYHHSSYWRVPMLACLPKVWFERLRGYDESFIERTWPDDSDFWVRAEAMGVTPLNPPDIWGAHQFHVQRDIECGEGCPCPLSQKSRTHPGEALKYGGTPEDLVRNPVSWGELVDSYEA